MRRRSRKIPLAGAKQPVKSQREARKITSSFHSLARELEGAVGRGDEASAAVLRVRMEEARPRYQDASILATSSFRTSRWVYRVLEETGCRPPVGEERLKVLEVGAVNTQLLATPFLDVRAIDIHAKHPRIEEIDYFDLAVQPDFDCVVCAMVLNCLPSAQLRGEMLRRARSMLRASGLLFVMLPRLCVARSPFMTQEHLLRLAAALGLQPVRARVTPKVVMLCLQRAWAPPGTPAAHPRLVALRSAPTPGAPRAADAKARGPDASSDFVPVLHRHWSRLDDAELAAAFPDPSPRIVTGEKMTNTFSVAFARQATKRRTAGSGGGGEGKGVGVGAGAPSPMSKRRRRPEPTALQ